MFINRTPLLIEHIYLSNTLFEHLYHSNIFVIRIFEHLYYSNNFNIQTSLSFEHLYYSNFFIIRTSLLFEHLCYSNSFIIRTPFEHFGISLPPIPATCGVVTSFLFVPPIYFNIHYLCKNIISSTIYADQWLLS